jgi:hypothetical protein
MSGFSFLPGDGQIPELPLEIPTTETPPPDFKTIGQTFAAAQTEAQKALREAPGSFDWLWKQLLRWVGAVLGVVVDIVSIVLQQVFRIFSGADPSVNQLIAVVMSGMFGSEIPVSFGASIKDAAGRKVMTASIAKVFTNALGKGQDSGQGLKPSDEGMQAFMEAAAHMAFEGWLLGWLAEAGTLGQMETFAELKDIMEASLGIGRMARRVMSPALKVLVEDPYSWLLHKTWHPTLLSPGEAVRFYLRDGINREGLQAIMDLHGYSSTLVDELIWDQVKQPSPVDIRMLLDHGDMDEAAAIKSLKRQGYDATTAQQQLTAMRHARSDSWNRELVNVTMEQFKANKVSYAQTYKQIEVSGLPGEEQVALKHIADLYNDSRRTRFSIAEGEQLVKKGLWNLNQFRDLAVWHGYTLGDEQDLELLLLVEIKDAADAASKRQAAADARAAAKKLRDAAAAAKAFQAKLEIESKGVSQAQYETLVEEGLRTFQQYHAYLTSKGIAIDNADALVTVLGNKLASKQAAAALKAAAAGQAKAKSLDVAQLETAVKQGLLTVDDFIARMLQIGMTATDAALLGEELRGQITSAAVKEKAVADAKAAAAVKHVDVSQEERAVRLGIQTIQQYAAYLDAHGFEPHDRDVLVSALQAQLAADKQTAATKSGAAATLAGKGISLPQLERLVRAGVKTPADYQAALQAAGYNAADQAALVDYLKLQMEQDQQDLIVHGQAANLVGQLGPSLSDLGRAVRLGVIPIAAYQDALKRAGLSAADQQTLVKTLAAGIKTTRAQQSTAQTVSKQLAAAGISLLTLEKDVLSGKLTIEQFEGLLAGYGVPATQITDVLALMQDQLDNQAAVQALVNQAGARAAAKGLNLAQDTAAYKEGVMPEYEWRSRVADLGYDDADVEILFEILAAQQAAVAAKSAKKAPAVSSKAAPGAAAATAGG